MLYQMFLNITFHRTLFFRYFSAWSACTGGENQDGTPLPLGDTPQPQESWRIPLNSLRVLPDDHIGGFLLHPGLRMLACDGCCLCQI